MTYAEPKVHGPVGKEIGREPVPIRLITAELGLSRRQATVAESEPETLENGNYWVSKDSWGTEVSKGVWEGIPTATGIYKNNGNGTYTELFIPSNSSGWAPRSERIPVSERLEVGATPDKVKNHPEHMKNTLMLIGGSDHYGITSRMFVMSVDRIYGEDVTARLISMPKGEVAPNHAAEAGAVKRE